MPVALIHRDQASNTTKPEFNTRGNGRSSMLIKELHNFFQDFSGEPANRVISVRLFEDLLFLRGLFLQLFPERQVEIRRKIDLDGRLAFRGNQ